MGIDPKVSGRKGRLASPWNQGANCATRKAAAAHEAILRHPRPPREVGSLHGNLDVLGMTIKQLIIHSAGDEFLVWAEGDRVFAAWDTTAAARKVQAERPEWIVNNYRSRWEIRGERIYLEAKHITEDLAYFLEHREVVA